MRFEIRTASRAISTLVVLFVLVLGASLDTLAQGNSRRGRSHNRGRHLGWERGRRVGQHRRDNDRSRRRRIVRRERRQDRRENRRERRIGRRSSWDNNRDWQRSRFDRSNFRTRRFTQQRGGRGRH
ncbi:MAG TPA: hypothetical protein VF588_20570 [Pyrinomonadaceae bacterium]|jgi:hypothetical protein